MERTLHITGSIEIPVAEIELQFTRSAGPGGQNVNKVATRVEASFDVFQSTALTGAQKQRLQTSLGSRLAADGILRVASQESRSQWRNREDALAKLAALLRAGLAVEKPRVATAPSRASRQKRVARKRVTSMRKKMRGRVRDIPE